MKFVIPNVDLKKFYKICAFQKVSAKDVRLNEKTVKTYKKFRDFLFGGTIKAESNTIFMDNLRESILSKIISRDDLSKLDNKPLTPMILKNSLESKKHQISFTSVKNLLSLLMKAYLIDQIPIMKTIIMEDEEAQDKALIYHYLLRSKDFLSVKKVKKSFRNSPRAHRINNYLIELWVDSKVDIKGIDIPRELCNEYEYTNLPPNKVKGYKSIETYRIRETGELRASIAISDNYKLFPIGD
ncbi:MAG: hypothetical protein ACFFEN_13125 [Candidatus Thorarchaeota archaeon]